MLRLAGLVHEHLADLELPVHDVFLQQGTASTWSAHGRHTDSTYYSNT